MQRAARIRAALLLCPEITLFPPQKVILTYAENSFSFFLILILLLPTKPMITMKTQLTTLLLLLTCPFLSAQTLSPFIHIDQFGYLSNAEKVAVLSDPIVGFNAGQSYFPGNVLEVRESSSGNLVFSGTPTAWNSGQTHSQSGDRGWWFDFSQVTSAGNYYLNDPLNNERSADFEIADNPYSMVLKQAGRMYFYNRSGIAKVPPHAAPNWVDSDVAFGHTFQDGACRYVYDSTNTLLERDLSGGWFDAGDFNKYVNYTMEPLHNLLWAFEENPQAFGDNWNIPESGNGTPDLLDEIIWELDWLKKMNNSDGSTQIKVGSVSYNDNALSPPGANVDPTYYGPTCTSSSIAVASVFAHAARVLQAFPQMLQYAQDLEARAIASWTYVLPFLNTSTLETACDDGTIKSTQSDWTLDEQKDNAVAAAIHLFALTSNSNYNQYIIQNYLATEPISTSWIGPYKSALNDALLHYTTLSSADPTARTTILNTFSSAISNTGNDFWGVNNNDLYRAFAPDWMYHWGSNSPKAALASLNTVVNRYTLVPASSTERDWRAAEMLHNFHGVNPLGLVQLSNMYAFGGDRCVNQIYHGWFADGSPWDDAATGPGPPPGYLTGGPNASFSVTNISPPAGQPEQKSYLDFNDDFPNNSWEISEPAIYYQAAYIRLLANYVSGPLTHLEDQALPSSISIYPNPGSGQVHLFGCEKGDRIVVYDLLGHKLKTLEAKEPRVLVDLSDSPEGIYFFRIGRPGEMNVQNLRWVKQ